jgi:hypothetical protein
MIYDERALAKYRLERCYEALSDCDLLAKSGSTPGALAMGLRAAKEAAHAALLALGNQEVRTESLLSLTGALVRDGKTQASSYNAFRNMMDLCQFASERDFAAVGPSEAGAAIEAVKYFIREMADIIKESEA